MKRLTGDHCRCGFSAAFFAVSLFSIFRTNSDLAAQPSESPLRLCGYFQTNYIQYNQVEAGCRDAKTFTMQQLSLFLQNDLDRDLTTFVNFEFLDNCESGQQRGTFSVEEA
ncbi:MAG: hypothetical protein WBP42_04165 [Candidatus Zixiibacteriota bacterium]